MTEQYVDYLDDNQTKSSIDLLNHGVAIALDLTLAIKQAHWNIKGPSFIGIHLLLDQVADRMREHADLMAERCVILGGTAKGTSQVVAETDTMSPYPVDAVHQDTHIVELKSRLIAYSNFLHKAVRDTAETGDDETSDLFTGVSRGVSKDAWFIGAHHTTATK